MAAPHLGRATAGQLWVESFEAFYERSYPQTVRLAHLLTGSNAAAEDVAQEAMVKVHLRFSRLDNPGGYLHTVTVNLCRRWHRTNFREQRSLGRLGLLDAPSSLAADEMADALGHLSYRQRAVLVLRYWMDLSEQDIARHLGCRVGTVKSLCSRALDQLRKELPQ